MSVCVCVCVCVRERVRVRESERERERERESCISVSVAGVCVGEWEGVRVGVIMCVVWGCGVGMCGCVGGVGKWVGTTWKGLSSNSACRYSFLSITTDAGCM